MSRNRRRRPRRTVRARVGYEVIEASSADEGEQLAVSFPGRVHLVIADVNLGGATGPELGERLRRRDPELRLLYISGREDEESLGDGPNASFLLKPFAAALMVQRVRELLG